MEREPSGNDSPDRLAGDHSPARATKAAQHEDELSPAKEYYPAEAYHVDYYRRNPDKAYCAATIGPKVSKLRTKYAARLKGSDPVRP